MFGALARVWKYGPIESLTRTIMIVGVCLALAAFILPPPDKYAPHSTLVFAWGAMLAALGVLLFVGVTQGPALPIVFTILIIIAGIGALGYSLIRAGENDRRPKPPSTGTSNL